MDNKHFVQVTSFWHPANVGQRQIPQKEKVNIKPGGMSVHPRNKTKHTGYSIIKQDGGTTHERLYRHD